MNPVLNEDTESTQFVRNVIKKGKKRIDYFSDRANKEKSKEVKAENIFNLSLKQIFENLSKTLIDLLTDIISGNIYSIADIFKGDRILYLGLLLFLIALGIYIVDITT